MFTLGYSKYSWISIISRRSWIARFCCKFPFERKEEYWLMRLLNLFIFFSIVIS